MGDGGGCGEGGDGDVTSIGGGGGVIVSCIDAGDERLGKDAEREDTSG